MHQPQTAFENIVEKEEIARCEQFLVFPQCFLLNQIILLKFRTYFLHHIFISCRLNHEDVKLGNLWRRGKLVGNQQFLSQLVTFASRIDQDQAAQNVQTEH